MKRDGKSTKRSFGLYGSAIGLVDSNFLDVGKHCFRVLDGVEYVVLQAESDASMMEWSIAIVHTISMENGGGILLDKEKLRVARDEFGFDSAGFPIDNIARSSSIVYGVKTEEAMSIVFTKPTKEINLGSGASGEVTKAHSSKLDTTHSTETTHEASSTSFNSVDNVELFYPMEHFACNFFDTNEQPSRNQFKRLLPIQALRSDVPEPWHMIDGASSESSAAEIFDKVSDFEENTQLNAEEYSKLVQLTKSAGGEEI